MRIIYFGSRDAGYYGLKYLLEKNSNIIAVVTTEDSPKAWFHSVKQLAETYHLPIFTPKKVKDPEFIKILTDYRADVIFSMYYDKIIPLEILRSAVYNMNFHGGLLPKYRGCVSSAWAIINNEPETAVTAHIMDPEIDTGDIIQEKRVKIEWEDTCKTLYNKVSVAAVELLKEILPQIERGELTTRPQERGGNYYSRDLPYQGVINWNKSSLEIYNFIRAMNFPPFNPAKTFFRGEEIFIEETKLFPSELLNSEQKIIYGSDHSGKILEIKDQGLVISAGVGQILISKLRVKSNNFKAQDFALCFGLKVGEYFGKKNRKELLLGTRKVGAGYPVFIIAEAGVNHNGNLEIAKKLIDKAVEAGADAVKFQSFKADKLNTRTAPKANYHLETTGKEGSWFDLLKSQEVSREMHFALSAYCKDKGIMFLSTPYDKDSVDLLEEVGVPAYKIASTDLTNLPLLEHVARKGKPIILPTGLCSYEEIAEAVDCIKKAGNEQIILLQCTANYPTKIENANLVVMEELRRRFGTLVGYSDHTPGMVLPIAATVLGSCLHEKHFTLSKDLPGPDHRASIDSEELKEMVLVIRSAQSSLGKIGNKPTESEKENISKLRKSVVADKAIPFGKTIVPEDITAKRPGTGVHPRHWKDFIGKKALKEIEEDELLDFQMVQ